MSDAIQRTGDDEGLSTPLSGFVPMKARLTVESLAQCLGVDAKTVHRWNQQYELPARQPGKHVLIDTDEWWNALPRKIYGQAPEEPER